MRAHFVMAIVLATGCANVLGIENPSSGGGSGDDSGDDAVTPVLKSIKVEPNPLTLPAGATQQLKAIATYADGSSADVTEQTTWTVQGGAAVVVTSDGVASGVSEGSVTVVGSIGDVAGAALATVGVAAPDELQFSLADFTVDQQQGARFRVRVHLTDGGSQDATLAVNYATSNASIATIAGPGRVVTGTQAGTVTLTANLGDITGQIRVTVTAQPCHPMINEIQTGSDFSASDEFIEVHNPCVNPVDVTGWTLVYRGAGVVGTTDSTALVTMSGTMQPGTYRMYCGELFLGSGEDGYWPGEFGSIGQISGAVGLRAGPKDTGTLVDSLAYGAVTGGHPFIEGTAAPMMANNKTAVRMPFDGNDRGMNTMDFQILPSTSATPRAPNVP